MRPRRLRGSCGQAESAFLSSPARIPDRGVNLAFVFRRVIEIINRHHFAIRTLHASGVTQVPAASIVPKENFIAPRLALVGTETCPDTEGSGTAAISQRQAAIGQVNETGRGVCVDRGAG